MYTLSDPPISCNSRTLPNGGKVQISKGNRYAEYKAAAELFARLASNREKLNFHGRRCLAFDILEWIEAEYGPTSRHLVFEMAKSRVVQWKGGSMNALGSIFNGAPWLFYPLAVANLGLLTLLAFGIVELLRRG